MTISTSWQDIVESGAERSVAVLSGMIGQNLELGALKTELLTIDEISERAGGAGQSLTVIYLSYWGDASGHMTLFLNADVTSRLLELLTGAPHASNSPFSEIERSGLGEIGNVVGSAFLNSISDATGMIVRPSPPDVIVDMVGAVVDLVAADVMAEDGGVHVVEVPFNAPKAGIEGTFLVIPSSDLLSQISGAMGAAT